MTAMHDPDGRLTGFFKVLRDQTDRKQIEDQRARLLAREQAARESAEEATRLKDEFLAVVSHELRTPLSAILLWSKLLRAGIVDDKARDEALQIIEQSARSQHAIVEDLLDVSRIMSGKLRLSIRPAELAPILEAAIEAVRPMADSKAIRIELSNDPCDGLVRVDPDRIQQVVWNLLTNAVKFTHPGGRIDVSLSRDGAHTQIRVTDTGQGISPEFLPHVFDRFRQADASTTRLESGLGLGLAITKQLVELQGGSITAQSAGQGKGAAFTVRLPLVAAPSIGDRPGRAQLSDAAFVPSAALKGLWVLLVEDDDPTRRAVSWVLESSGAEVTAVPSTAEALRALSADLSGKRPDVLVSDIAMPGQDGCELLRQLRRIEAQRGHPPIPAAALTAYGREEDRQKVLDVGFQQYLRKPIDPNELVKTIRSLA